MKAVSNGEKIAVAAKSFGVPRVTLYNKVPEKTPINCTLEPNTVLSKERKEILVRCLSALVDNGADFEPALQTTTLNLSRSGSPQNQDKESQNALIPEENHTDLETACRSDLQFHSAMSPRTIEVVNNYDVTEDEMVAIPDPIQHSNIDPAIPSKHYTKSNSCSKSLTNKHPTTNHNIFEIVSASKNTQ
ncbi:hypothetical protein HHI36_023296 [Cryptolaemus montrouzieri]|uniref:HTH psq-type domain-containing protein n=1 Tax=Cryptolaemus montrouzieri TaxID=559131 RepID=A0ABD2PGV4_9CUCU